MPELWRTFSLNIQRGELQILVCDVMKKLNSPLY